MVELEKAKSDIVELKGGMSVLTQQLTSSALKSLASQISQILKLNSVVTNDALVVQ
jgi:hypothetical protein